MKDTRDWKCPCCGRRNDYEMEICICGDSHRDEKVCQHVDKRDGEGQACAVVLFVGAVLVTLGLAYWLAHL